MPEPSMISAHQLRQSFGSFEAVAGIDVRRGEAFGFLGPNGAGKSHDAHGGRDQPGRTRTAEHPIGLLRMKAASRRLSDLLLT